MKCNFVYPVSSIIGGEENQVSQQNHDEFRYYWHSSRIRTWCFFAQSFLYYYSLALIVTIEYHLTSYQSTCIIGPSMNHHSDFWTVFRCLFNDNCQGESMRNAYRSGESVHRKRAAVLVGKFIHHPHILAAIQMTFRPYRHFYPIWNPELEVRIFLVKYTAPVFSFKFNRFLFYSPTQRTRKCEQNRVIKIKMRSYFLLKLLLW